MGSNLSNTNWDEVIHEQKVVNVIPEEIKNIITKTANEYIPNKQINVRTDLPRIINRIRRIMRKRNRARKKANNTNRETDWAKYRKRRNTVVNCLRKAKKAHQNKIGER